MFVRIFFFIVVSSNLIYLPYIIFIYIFYVNFLYSQVLLKFWSMILRDKSYIKNQIFGGM